MKRGVVLMMAMLAVLSFAAASAQKRPETATIDVYKSPTCGCCNGWVAHLRENGFTVRTTDTENVDELKTRHRVPQHARSCHTALVSGYVIEGHVPAAEVRRLLSERPPVAGLAVAGMPIGSPGMETPGVKPQPYHVLAFDKEGRTRVFATQNR